MMPGQEDFMRNGALTDITRRINDLEKFMREIRSGNGVAGSSITFARVGTNNAIVAGSPTTVLASLLSDGSNRFMFGHGMNNTTVNSYTFNAGNFTALQNGTGALPYVGYLLPSAATAAVGGIHTVATGVGSVIVLNGVNQSSPVGVLATGVGPSAAPSVVVACAVGDFIVGGFTDIANTPFTVNSRGAGQTNVADYQETPWHHTVIDYIIATSTLMTLTWGLSAAPNWKSFGVAVKSA